MRQVGQEVAGPLTAALERVVQLTSTGRIDRQSLRALRTEIERARHAGMVSQQLARIESGTLKLSREHLHLPQLLRDLLALRQRDLQAHGVTVRPVVGAVDVQCDPTLLFAMLNALVDWVVAQAHDAVELKIDQKLWPEVARIQCRYAPQARSSASQFADLDPSANDRLAELQDLNWHLLERLAKALQVRLMAAMKDGHVLLVLEFPTSAADAVEGLSVTELDHGFHASTLARPVAGSHVLVVASRRNVRVQVRDAVRDMGLVVDFVGSVEEAGDFCRQGLPHALIIESVLRGERFDHLRAELLARAPTMAFIELIEEGSSFEISGFSGSSIAKVGRDAIAQSLPSALAYELSRDL